ncbi:MAG: cytochrome c [Anaerolineales bacterium]|nr:cytochrome c [Anaerolineales bacterium]
MKSRHYLFFAILALGLAACNFTLAADVTPPPGYVSPTPPATLGPLFPAHAPDLANGEKIYAEKCAACHGPTGMGDGPQSKDLPVSVAALGLPEVANPAAPAAWYATVSQGNLERFMPPFLSLSDQERWDVVSYALTLHTTAEQIETGKKLFETKCAANCAEQYSNPETLSALSQNELAANLQKDQSFLTALTSDEALAVAAYIRTRTFAAPQATPTPAPTTETSATAETTPLAGTAQPSAGFGSVSGMVNNETGEALPANLKIKLRSFEHDGNPNNAPKEIASLESVVQPDGKYQFDAVELPENRILLAEVEVNGVPYQSDFFIVKAESASVEMAPITAYRATEDYSGLQVTDLQYYFDYANPNDVQILAVYSILNPTNQTVILKQDGSQDIPFLKTPAGVTNLGYETSQDSAPILSLANGFALPPSAEKPYSIIALGSAPKNETIQIEQPVVLDVTNVMLLVPEGVEAEGATLTNGGPHPFQNRTFNMYTAGSLKAGATLTFTLSGSPKNTAVNPDVTQNQNLLIGLGAVGLALIVIGGWLYWKDRNNTETTEDDSETDDAETTLDAILTLDDLRRAGKISDSAYQKRRAELKGKLKK